ncbi:MAG: alpha/beta hydrolase [Candidatus Marinimicrobia bacterium]|nr:alpha/beta hydrolase [Candidatus Neomarinimicrobiota bacterium]
MKTPFPTHFSVNSRGTARKGSLIFLHANSYSADLYQPFLEPLQNDYKILAPDLPGHGNSRWTGQIQDWADLADHFIKLLEQDPPAAPLIGMGHSIGAVVMMMMAIRKPDWFQRIILLDPVLLPKYILWIMQGLRFTSLTQIIPLAKAADRRKWLFPSRQEALEHFSRKKVFSRWEPRFLEAYVDTCFHPTSGNQYQLSCAPQLESSIYQSLPLNAWTLPKKLTIPTLYIIGKHSDTVNQRGFRRLGKLGGIHVVKSITGGHLFPFEKPIASMALIKDFLKQ